MIMMHVSKYISRLEGPPTIQMHIWLQFIMCFEYIIHI
jgi:hypothetical protein